MPTILVLFGIRFYFYSREHEPMHVHIENSDGRAKFELLPQVRLVENKGMKSKDIRLAESIIEENREYIIKEWKDRQGE
ncbi:MAG: DUF4160 domain-containing protein [Alistipes sp.]|nr:DUF4160 domain-containing protein [Alistipes sp.]